MKIDKIYPKLNEIESEIESLKILILERYQIPKQWISLRGMGKILGSEQELEHSIKEAKKSLFKENRNVLSG